MTGLGTRRRCWAVIALVALQLIPTTTRGQNLWMRDIQVDGDEVVVRASVDEDVDYVVLESKRDLNDANDQNLVVGELENRVADIEFRIPVENSNLFLTTRTYIGSRPPRGKYRDPRHFRAEYGDAPLSETQKKGHVLDRLGYGPSRASLEAIDALGVKDYIYAQLDPESIEESPTRITRERLLFDQVEPARETLLVELGDEWDFLPGSERPSSAWKRRSFRAEDWRTVRTGIGYSENDDIQFGTPLNDMRGTRTREGYASFFLRKRLILRDIEDFAELWLRMDYSDGFVAYINGAEVARANMEGESPSHEALATRSRALGRPEMFDLTPFISALDPRRSNVLAIQVHNDERDSATAGVFPELIHRVPVDRGERVHIEGMEELQELLHVRGVNSTRQLQAVLGEFWENHFTTDADKVLEYFDRIREIDGSDALDYEQAHLEAAQSEYIEYNYFHQNALGRFGDLLLYSATSVPQLIYLDTVSNTKEGPNENYAREILELFAFGVDNRYNQTDIEELARCFTGWSVEKVWPDQVKPFPESALNPIIATEEDYVDEPFIEVGDAWRLIKGTLEPTTDRRGAPTTEWTELDYDDGFWTRDAKTGIGYGDRDDETILRDMRRNYVSVYMRKEFQLGGQVDPSRMLLEVDYDDAFIAYLNGEEIARSRSMGTKSPPAHSDRAVQTHEATGEFETFYLDDVAHLFKTGGETNVLAIQAHNVDIVSDDFSILPRLVHRIPAPERVERGNPSGSWTFVFRPDDHDYSEKVIFAGTDHEIRIPATRRGRAGAQDAIDVIQSMTNHPSTREYICIKLINRFVSDEIALESYKDGSAPLALLELHQEAMDTWDRTNGDIREVLLTLLDPEEQDTYFWSRDAYRSKIKTPIEFVNSAIRALDGAGSSARTVMQDMGMNFFTRDDPNGWSEMGFDWVNTGAILNRIQFAQDLASAEEQIFRWSSLRLLREEDFQDASDVLNYVDRTFFQGSLSRGNRQVMEDFLLSDLNGRFRPLIPENRNDFEARLREFMGLVLSSPHWNYQ